VQYSAAVEGWDKEGGQEEEGEGKREGEACRGWKGIDWNGIE
jgi:hypothetical protein